MKPLVLAVALLAAGIGACGKTEEPAPPAAVEAPPAKAIGESCSQDCGGGAVAAIQCAEGETPVCDCTKAPNAVCQLGPPESKPGAP